MFVLRSFGAALVAATMLLTPAIAEDFPSRPIRVISPFAPGSASDTVARVVLDQVSQQIGQAMAIEARPGAGGSMGFESAAKADPNGYTLVVSSTSMGTELVLHRSLPYDPVRDFAPIALFGVQPNVLVVSAQSGFKTVADLIADLIAAAKAKPGTLTFASAGIGSSSHMAAERFRLATKIDVRHVPFRDGGLTEVMAGRIDFYFIPIAAAASALGSGKLAVLAVSSPKRSALLPDVPSIAEAGYPDAEFRFWVGMAAPVQTPREIVDKLHEATEKSLKNPAVVDRLARLGVTPELMDVDAFAKFAKDDFASTVALAKQAHIEPND
jgi:tripartite-type tricarboxylate transporter receptor subunit TctC